jgi:hypothetical protein
MLILRSWSVIILIGRLVVLKSVIFETVTDRSQLSPDLRRSRAIQLAKADGPSSSVSFLKKSAPAIIQTLITMTIRTA